MTRTEIDLTDQVQGILPLANGGTGTSNGIAATHVSGLATVATSGSYTDLSNTPDTTTPVHVIEYTGSAWPTRPNDSIPAIFIGGDGGGTQPTGAKAGDYWLPESSPALIGAPGSEGPAGPANTISIGTVTTGAAGSSAGATMTGTSPNQTLNLTIPQGAQGIQGNAGPANSLSIGTVTTGAANSSAAASITGAAPSQTLSLTIPQGIQGIQGNAGPANTLSIGTVTTGAAGSSAAASIGGTAPNQTLSLTIPRGNTGATNSLSIGTVTTGSAGSSAAASITGTAPSQTLNLTIPQGIQGSAPAGVVTGSNNGTTTALTLWTGTTAQYNAIGTKDSNTVYVYT